MFVCTLKECKPRINDDCCALVSTRNVVEPWEVINLFVWYFDLFVVAHYNAIV
jgi:hypothetical protein